MQVKPVTLFLLMFLPSVAVAGNKPANDQKATEEPPEAALLEFIAEFEPLDGQWIDPVQLNMIFAENRKGKRDE